jgi:hypothetical protein
MESYLSILDARSEAIAAKYPKVSIRNYAITYDEPLGGAHAGVDYHKYNEVSLDSAPVKEIWAYQTVFELKGEKDKPSLVSLIDTSGRHGGFGRTRFYALTRSAEPSGRQKRFFWDILTQVFGVKPWDAGRESDLDLLIVQGDLTKGYLPYVEMHRFDRMRE